jgi:hypothetical protein
VRRHDRLQLEAVQIADPLERLADMLGLSTSSVRACA